MKPVQAWLWGLAPVGLLASPLSFADLEQVLVSARRLQPLQQVPVSASVVTAEDIALLDLVHARDLARTVPGLTWQSTDGGSAGSVYLRGIGSPSIHSNQVGGVGLYLDDVSLLSPLFTTQTLFDLEQVEVVRGPSNSPYGRNAPGGAVRFVTRKPQIGRPAQAEIRLRAGSDEEFGQEVYADFPLGREAAARISLDHLSHGDNSSNTTLREEEGGYERSQARVALAWSPQADLDVDASLSGRWFDGDPIRYKQVGLGTPGSPGLSDCPYLAHDVDPGNGCVDQTGVASVRDFDVNASGRPKHYVARTTVGQLGAGGTLAGHRWRAVIGYAGTDFERAEDSDGGPSALFISNQESKTRQWSQEVSISSREDGRASWTVGLLHLQEDAHYTSSRRNPNALLTPVLEPGVAVPEEGLRANILFGDLDNEVREFSAYAIGDLQVGTSSTLHGELRGARSQLSGTQLSGLWADTRAEFAVTDFLGTAGIRSLLPRATSVAPGQPLPAVCPPPFVLTHCYVAAPYDRTDEEWGGKLSIDRRSGEAWMVYASLARGFKAAGISPIARDALVGAAGRVVDPESVLTYEAGAKWNAPSGGLKASLSVFYNDWRDYQLFLQVPTVIGPAVLLTNLPRARTSGFEAEMAWSAMPGWRIDAGVALVDSEVVDAGELENVVADSPLPGVPRVSASASVSKSWTRGGGQWTAVALGSWSSERRFSLDGDRTLIQEGVALFDATANYRFGRDGRFLAAVWAHNLTDERYCVLRQSSAGLGVGDIVACAPNEGGRRIGVTLEARFP